MDKINEGNLYNIETGEMKADRSSELDDTTKAMMDEFWTAMSRQNINPEIAKQIAKQTFRQS